MAGPNANLDNGQEIVTLPLSDDVPWYSFSIGLSGVQYNLTIRWDGRMNRWVMDIADATQNPILSGIVLLIGVNLIGRFTGLPNVPVGTFFVTDDVAGVNQPTRNSFGSTHRLWYLDPLAVT